MHRDLVPPVRIRSEAKISSTVVSRSAGQFQRADRAVAGVHLLNHVTVIGNCRLESEGQAGSSPDYGQRVIALRLAAQRGFRA